ncbi:MAG: hypothetical protein V4858_00790 [Pseudomonadota bacterium]
MAINVAFFKKHLSIGWTQGVARVHLLFGFGLLARRKPGILFAHVSQALVGLVCPAYL